jgi:hypothetical protein
MFYYLLYNSSFPFIVESRLFSTILYGSILYIVTHAILNFCDISILNIINNYYWTLFTLDIISFSYSLYQSFITENGDNTTNGNNLNVSFNLLKNKINTILDRKNDLTITQIPINQNNQNTHNNEYNQPQNQNNAKSHQSSNKYSTPISQLQNIKQNTNPSKNNKSSTPINLIRNNVDIIEPFIDDNDDNNNHHNNNNNNNNNNNQDNQYESSVAGSDVGSIMDLSDFETTL